MGDATKLFNKAIFEKKFWFFDHPVKYSTNLSFCFFWEKGGKTRFFENFGFWRWYWSYEVGRKKFFFVLTTIWRVAKVVGNSKKRILKNFWPLPSTFFGPAKMQKTTASNL